ncbi:MAG: TniB family NTP-binding protein [Paracoccus sp. (in: a-proteobacteria)]|nr:TniB family NTP-binding protein [Paracoccus sp. (in: a-proteobacteria)]
MTDRTDDIPQRVLALRSVFSETEPFHALQAEFVRQLGSRRAEIEAGRILPVKGIALIGASGSGKSTLAARLFRVTPDLVLAQDGLSRCDVVSLTVPSPATLKSVGRAILEALGYPLKRERTADAIWELVRVFLKERQVLFLHLDEAQDIARHQTPKEMQAVINTLKTMMQHPSWPVGLILSGMPALRDILNVDPQLARRVIPIELPRLSPIGDIEPLTEMTAFYAQEGGLAPADPRENADIAARLIEASDREFGLAIEITIDAVEEALRAKASKISKSHFAAAFARRSSCIDGLNPFIIDDYDRLDVRKLLAREGEL